MKLRQLELKDRNTMFEWMHDKFVVEKLQTDFMSKTIEDCIKFINNKDDAFNLNLAIVDDDDNYVGTVSLKHINNICAEFAIVIIKNVMGKGYAKFAMNEIIKVAFEKYKLIYIYWCVAKDNIRAIKFYDKNGYKQVDYNNINIDKAYTKDLIEKYLWYKIENNDL